MIINEIHRYCTTDPLGRNVEQVLHADCADEENPNQIFSKLYRQLVKEGKHALINQLLAKFPAAIHFPAPVTPLHQALYARKMADLLLNVPRRDSGHPDSGYEPYCFDASVDDYDAIINVLLKQAGEQLRQIITDDEFPYYKKLMHDYNSINKCTHNKYNHYTPLHLAIELRLIQHATSILDKMKDARQSLEQTCKLQERDGDGKPYVVKHYTALHLAIDRQEYDITRQLIEKGADYRAMATIEKSNPSWWQRYFWPVIKTHKSALSMVLETEDRKLITAVQLVQLTQYIKQREKEAQYKTKIMFFGHSLCHFGYNKDEKLNAARALQNVLLNSGSNTDRLVLDRFHEGVLSQGRLGAIAAPTKNCLEFETQPNLNL